MNKTVIEAKGISKYFAGIPALQNVSIQVKTGEVLCLLGDNGAGKSTLIKILSGVFRQSSGELLIDGEVAHLQNPGDARSRGIATVHQYGGTVPLISVARNFFLGAEPTLGRWPFRRLDTELANRVALEELQKLGIRRVMDAGQLVGTLSGGERQALAIARAVYFGARVLILDEPTSALGVKEASTVLRLIKQVSERGTSVILITHNAHHALTVGDSFAVLIQGEIAATFSRGEKSKLEVLNLMAGGEEIEALQAELEAS
ncbi:MAG: ATP-binding cassette domain-containing protein [Limimaricola sp.]|uniref:ATP-binding cassette domain-containing protein n=1 Tax=Limimaricola sp. TaxID=2211665 RepID=UPI001D92541C|nr:ATP-binding cassette domain-containing protein [Limimaricola sp.]MBI1417854.1 ATP-binding cassette domain-containing protein [Limimaricola sp.]